MINTNLALDLHWANDENLNSQRYAQTYTNNDTACQRWRIVKNYTSFSNADGTCRIMSCLKANYGFVLNGGTIQVWDYAVRDIRRFAFETVAHGQFTLGATIDEDGADRGWYISKSMNAVACMGYSQLNYGPSYGNSTGGLNSLQNSTLWTIHTHGSRTTVKYTASNGTTSDITTTDIDNLPDFALKNSRLIIYGTCSAGEGGVNATNIVNSTYNKGAKTVIGFQVVTYVNQTNRWLHEFLIAAGEKGKTISESCADADYWVGIYFLGFHGGTDNRLVRGSTSQCLVS